MIPSAMSYQITLLLLALAAPLMAVYTGRAQDPPAPEVSISEYFAVEHGSGHFTIEANKARTEGACTVSYPMSNREVFVATKIVNAVEDTTLTLRYYYYTNDEQNQAQTGSIIVIRKDKKGVTQAYTPDDGRFVPNQDYTDLFENFVEVSHNLFTTYKPTGDEEKDAAALAKIVSDR